MISRADFVPAAGGRAGIAVPAVCGVGAGDVSLEDPHAVDIGRYGGVPQSAHAMRDLCLYPAQARAATTETRGEVTVMKGPMQAFWTQVVERRRQLRTRVVDRRGQVMKRNRQWIKVHILGRPAQ